MKFSVLKLNDKNLNKIIYTKECIEKYLDPAFDPSKLTVHHKDPSGLHNAYGTDLIPNLTSIIGVVKSFELEDDILYCDVKFINGGVIYENEVIADSFVIRPCGTGEVNSDGLVINYNLIYFAIINKSEDSFKGIL